jgi:hypothetical protein
VVVEVVVVEVEVAAEEENVVLFPQTHANPRHNKTSPKMKATTTTTRILLLLLRQNVIRVVQGVEEEEVVLRPKPLGAEEEEGLILDVVARIKSTGKRKRRMVPKLLLRLRLQRKLLLLLPLLLYKMKKITLPHHSSRAFRKAAATA